MSNTPYISLNDAAKMTGRAKSTISKALKNGKMSYISRDDETGAYEIDPAEAMRVFPPKQRTGGGDQEETPISNPQNTIGNSALSMEVKILREQMAQMETMHERERDLLVDQIADLKTEAERRSAEHMKALAMLTDQREQQPKRGFWARLMG